MADNWDRGGSRKCAEGCQCAKHKAHPCPAGCVCSRHTHDFKKEKCAAGCTCGRHTRKKCEPGCTCNRHKAPHNWTSEEERAAAHERRRIRMREYMRAKRAEDPKQFQRITTPQQRRAYWLKHRHGITVEQWEDLYQAQSGLCYLCQEPIDRSKADLDHDHGCCPDKRACGSCFRGLACKSCNQGIGQFGDDPERMRRVADNLERANRRLRGGVSKTA